MTEPIIWEIELPDVTIEDIFRAEGADYSKSPPRPSTLELHGRVLAEAASLVRPAVLWREVDVLGAGEGELFLEGGKKLTSSLLARVAGAAEKLILFVMTIGSALDQREEYYSKAGRTLEAFVLNAGGTAYILKSGIAAKDKINEHYQKAGLNTTFSLGPGHSYWNSLEDIKTIFHLLNAGQMGLRLTDSNLMLPRKSIAMVLAAGRDLPDFGGKTHCDFCSLQKKCHISHF
ncbi:methionine synthase activation domain [Desulfocucumis palustris]|uniref:Methionine synthase activation domain n=1 Tax=Desulfocucumis palustris TaxID=1898651 RepID=A0A2L2X997_9FIRM|nr:Vitamin B12 dependent methionine synthase activation subunit [Desulfocucumis palustris]GBF32602.1 methionine synthase activation domain [Desulfocucumis palustris]